MKEELVDEDGAQAVDPWRGLNAYLQIPGWSIMASATDLIEPLSELAKKCIDHGTFGYAENFCNLLVAISSGRWEQLPNDERELWLTRLDNLLCFRGLGEAEWVCRDFDYDNVRGLASGLLKACQRAQM